MRSKLVYSAIIALLCYVIVLFARGELTLYIHPRYELFTVIFCSLLLLAFCISSFHTKTTFPKTGWLVLGIAVVALGLQPRPLSAQLAGLRTASVATTTISTSSVDVFSTDLTRFTIRDWDAYLRSNPPREVIIGKQAQVEGFLYTANQQLFVARYQLTCCAVDASPLVVPIVAPTIDYSLGQWVQIKGTFSSTESADWPLQLVINELTTIPEPKEPYVF